MRYESVQNLNREGLLLSLGSQDPLVVAEALYSAARFEVDTQWVQDVLLDNIKSPHLQVRWAAATCLGDMAFWGRELDQGRVTRALEMAVRDPETADPASVSLSMVKQFLNKG